MNGFVQETHFYMFSLKYFMTFYVKLKLILQSPILHNYLDKPMAEIHHHTQPLTNNKILHSH